MKSKRSDTKDTDNTTTTRHVSTSALQTSAPGFLRLPFEIRTIIWEYVLADGASCLVVDKTKSRYGTTAYRVRSPGDRFAIFPPHPLCYVCKFWYAEVKDQLYNSTLFQAPSTPGLWNHLSPKVYFQIVRLQTSMSQAVMALQCFVPTLESDDDETTRELILLNLPRLKYLEIEWKVWWPDADFDCDPGTRGYTKYQRTFARLIFYNKSFEVNIKILGIHLHPSFVACVATIEGTSVNYEYHEDVRRKEEFERNVERVIFAGRSREGQQELERSAPSEDHVGIVTPVTTEHSGRKHSTISHIRNVFRGRRLSDRPT